MALPRRHMVTNAVKIRDNKMNLYVNMDISIFWNGTKKKTIFFSFERSDFLPFPFIHITLSLEKNECRNWSISFSYHFVLLFLYFIRIVAVRSCCFLHLHYCTTATTHTDRSIVVVLETVLSSANVWHGRAISTVIKMFSGDVLFFWFTSLSSIHSFATDAIVTDVGSDFVSVVTFSYFGYFYTFKASLSVISQTLLSV